MSKDNLQKGVENEKQWEEGEESELQKSFDLEVIKTFILKSLLKRGGRSKKLLQTG